ncbi:hypothetical protein BJ742DRAFT_233917 [Cladochytrium replicatum]|nr:hypothetical protein BJ742DRAFT_233917 [Cladochytrium replicatum]
MVEWVIKGLESAITKRKETTDDATGSEAIFSMDVPAASLARAVQKDFQLRLLLKQMKLEEGEDDRGNWLFPRVLRTETMEELLIAIKQSIEMAVARNRKEDPHKFVRKKVQYRKRKNGADSDDDGSSSENLQREGDGEDFGLAERALGTAGKQRKRRKKFVEETEELIEQPTRRRKGSTKKQPVSSKFIGDTDDELNDPDFFERELIQREVNRRNIEAALRAGREDPEGEKQPSTSSTTAKVATQQKHKRGRKGREPSKSLEEGAERLYKIVAALNSDTDDDHNKHSSATTSSNSSEDEADSESDSSVQSGPSRSAEVRRMPNRRHHALASKTSTTNNDFVTDLVQELSNPQPKRNAGAAVDARTESPKRSNDEIDADEASAGNEESPGASRSTTTTSKRRRLFVVSDEETG